MDPKGEFIGVAVGRGEELAGKLLVTVFLAAASPIESLDPPERIGLLIGEEGLCEISDRGFWADNIFSRVKISKRGFLICLFLKGRKFLFQRP